MTILRRILVALLAAATLAPGPARAAATTNYSDQWWVPGESGWGASILQQCDVLFIDLFVYAADGRPTWFTAAATHQAGPAGHQMFSGDLQLTSGPYYNAPWNPAAVGYRKVGTLTFDATTGNDATLTYTVDGALMVKNVTRQLWRYENLSGRYYGGESGVLSSCTNPADNGPYDAPESIEIRQTADRLVIATFTDARNQALTITGIYSQYGHMGQVNGTLSGSGAGTGITGTATLFEIESGVAGITGRSRLVLRGPGDAWACTIDGQWGGVRR